MSAKMAVKAESMAPTVLGSNPAEAGVVPIVVWTDSRAFMVSFSCGFRAAWGQASDVSLGARLYREISMSDPPISNDIRRRDDSTCVGAARQAKRRRTVRTRWR